jgi:hypothetical protein
MVLPGVAMTDKPTPTPFEHSVITECFAIQDLEEELRSRKAELLEYLGEEADALRASRVLAILYWRHSNITNSVDLAEILNCTNLSLRKMCGRIKVCLECLDCGDEVEVTCKSRAELTRRRTIVLCVACEETRRVQRERDAAAWHQRSTALVAQRSARIEALRSMPYGDYLQTPEWRERRLYALRRARYACQLCSSKTQLQVHHRTYERRGNEKEEDLIVLCDDCHSKFHDKPSLSEKAASL